MTAPAVHSTSPPQRSTRRFLIGFLIVALVIAGLVSFYASAHPDGLEFVAEATGFGETARDSATAGSPLADYSVVGVDDARLSGGLAGIIGALVTLFVAGGLAMLLRRRTGAGPKV